MDQAWEIGMDSMKRSSKLSTPSMAGFLVLGLDMEISVDRVIFWNGHGRRGDLREK
jgi:hypothetical protein